MQKPYTTVLFLLVVILSCSRCKEECDDSTNPECPNYIEPIETNECEGVIQTSADFSMFQKMNRPNDTDTLIEFFEFCFSTKEVVFHANQEDATYHWVIGADHYYSQDVNIVFGAEFEDQNIPITLIVEREPNNICFPNDNGIDTVVVNVVPKSRCEASFFGKFRGAWDDNPLDSFTIEFGPVESKFSPCSNLFIVGAKPNMPDTCFQGNWYGVHNYVLINAPTTLCYGPIGVVSIESTLHNIIFDYSINVTNSTNEFREDHIFRGHLIN